jgi:hypothetical protein
MFFTFSFKLCSHRFLLWPTEKHEANMTVSKSWTVEIHSLPMLVIRKFKIPFCYLCVDLALNSIYDGQRPFSELYLTHVTFLESRKLNQAVTLLICIQEVSGSNLGRTLTVLTGVYHGLSQCIHTSTSIMLKIRRSLLPFISLPIHYSLSPRYHMLYSVSYSH